jgi:hypothetical protein
MVLSHAKNEAELVKLPVEEVHSKPDETSCAKAVRPQLNKTKKIPMDFIIERLRFSRI